MQRTSITEMVTADSGNVYLIAAIPNVKGTWTLAIVPNDGDKVLYSTCVEGDADDALAEGHLWVTGREDRISRRVTA